MLLKMQDELAKNYKSPSQKIRVISENWLKTNGYCVNCGAKLEQYANNKPVSDFYCARCKEDYELKSKKGNSNIITDGAYSTMIEKIRADEIPNFFYLNYKENYDILNFVVIPKHYFTEEIIQKRPPLKPGTRREGWVGCNINLKPIPESGRIYLIKNAQIQSKDNVVKLFNKTIFLRKNKNVDLKGWTLDIMKCIDNINKNEFSLDEMYLFENDLSLKHPENNNVKPKIRQQLQILRDNNYLKFLGKGKYKLK